MDKTELTDPGVGARRVSGEKVSWEKTLASVPLTCDETHMFAYNNALCRTKVKCQNDTLWDEESKFLPIQGKAQTNF